MWSWGSDRALRPGSHARRLCDLEQVTSLFSCLSYKSSSSPVALLCRFYFMGECTEIASDRHRTSFLGSRRCQ